MPFLEISGDVGTKTYRGGGGSGSPEINSGPVPGGCAIQDNRIDTSTNPGRGQRSQRRGPVPAPERPEEFPTVFQPCLQVSQGRAEPFKGLEYFLSRNPSDCPLRVPSPNSAPLSYTHYTKMFLYMWCNVCGFFDIKSHFSEESMRLFFSILSMVWLIYSPCFQCFSLFISLMD